MQPYIEGDASIFLMPSYLLKTRVVGTQKLVTVSDYLHWIFPTQAKSVGNRRRVMSFVCVWFCSGLSQ